MLEKYKNEHDITYKILSNSIKNDRCSHAYLFEVNDYDYAVSLIKEFIKEIMSSNIDDLNNLYQKIDDDILEEIKIIEPDGLMIKKEQILELHEWIKSKPIFIPNKVVIIKKADTMNNHSANSMLKILEEPPVSCLFFLITDNINGLLPTIISRLQLIRLRKDNKKTDNFIEQFIQENINCNSSIDEIKKMLEFISFMESNTISKILVNENYINWFENKEEVLLFLDLLIFIYRTSLTIKTLDYRIKNQELLNEILRSNNKNQLIKKISITIDLKAKIEYNMNNLLLRDYLIIKLKEVLS